MTSGNLNAIGGYSYQDDSEGHVATVAINGSSTAYGYDGENRRRLKQTPAGTTIYVYDASGDLGAEYSKIAEKNPRGTCCLTADHRGSTRVLTNSAGSVVFQRDYLPFGEEVPFGYSGRAALSGLQAARADDVNQKFTAKERDAESGLDYFGASYYGSALGRFTSPDPTPYGIAMSDPQSWNLYSYVGNRPTLATDTNGAWATNIHADIVTYALQGYLSSGEIAALRSRQYSMDGDQSNQSTHAMANPGQSPTDASTAIGGFIYGRLKAADAGVSNGQFTQAGLEAFGDALHTLQDLTSPMHTDAAFMPKVWDGGFGSLSQIGRGYLHVTGESAPDQDWSRIGQAVRLSMSALLNSPHACEAGKRCLTQQNFESEFQKNVADYVSHYYATGNYDGSGKWSLKQDAARLCALGNPAACGF